MIENKLSDAAIALNDIEELKKEISAKEKNNNIDFNYFYDVALTQTNSEVTYNFTSIDRSILNILINCDVPSENDYVLTVKNNGMVIFKEKYYAKSEINAVFSCVLSKLNRFQIYINSLALVPLKLNINMCGRFNDLLKNLSFLTMNSENNKYSLTHFGKYAILNQNSSTSDLIETGVLSGDHFINAVDMKEVKIGENQKGLILAKSLGSDYLYQYRIDENYPSSLVSNQSFSDATIIPVDNVNYDYLIAIALDENVRINYYSSDFTLDCYTILGNINHVNKIDCAVDLNSDFNHIILSFIDKFDNCYLCGCCNCESDFSELEINTDNVFVGKGKQVNCYLNGNQIIVYLNDGYNNITKNVYSITVLGGGYYLKKVSSQVFKNTDQVFLVGEDEILLKNGVYRLNE